MNEYHEAFEELQDSHGFRGQQWFGKRQELVEKYSWAIPNEDVLAYLSEFGSLYEVGAGSGYWANLLEGRGVDMFAVDANPPPDTWTTVHHREFHEIADNVEDEPVLMVWPPLHEKMASNVAYARPSHILYVGEQAGGCTGDDRFFEALEERYGLVARIEIPSYAGVHDDFYHYVRNV